MRFLSLGLLRVLLAPAALRAHDFPPEPDPLVQRVAFGSCSSPFDEKPVWQSVAATATDLWIWLGDTIYADSPRPVAATAEARAREPDGHEIDPGYPLYDLTSSAPTKSAPTTLEGMQARSPARHVTFWQEINRHRIGGRLPYNHFGLLEIAWDAPEGPLLTLGLRLDDGTEVLRHHIPLSTLQPAR